MRTRITIIVIAALASLALIPVGSAQGALRSAPFCTTISGQYVTLAPGKRCSFWPLVTKDFTAAFNNPSSGSGVICGAITHYPGGYPIDGYGNPTNWNCRGVREPGLPFNYVFGDVVGGFGAIYGQATVLNFSNRTIQFIRADWGVVRWYD